MPKVVKVTPWSEKNILASAKNVVSKTTLYTQAGAPAANANGRRIYLAGSAFPANDATGIGVVPYDIDVTDGDTEGPRYVEAWLDGDKLPVALTAEFLEAMPKITVLKKQA